MKRVHDSLDQTFLRHRLVLWYDPDQEWGETFDAFPADGITKLRVSGNELATKIRVVRNPQPDARFLLYIPDARPSDADNWLLDLLLQGHEYKADKASLALQDAGLSYEFLHIAEEHAAYFRSGKRTQALGELLEPNDQDREVRLKMMAVLAGATADVNALLLRFLSQGSDPKLIDPVAENLGDAGLVDWFWREVTRVFGYAADTPSLRDFTVSLFRGANPLEPGVKLSQHSRVFLRQWQDSQTYADSYRQWSAQMEADLKIKAALEESSRRVDLGHSDVFEIFEKYVLHGLCQAFHEGRPADALRGDIQQRRASFWYADHADGYAALEQAVELRELLDGIELTVDSVAAGARRYASAWWKVDMAYRRATLALRRYGQVQLMERVAQWVEGAYVNNFLLPLADRWSDQVGPLSSWECDEMPAQRNFYRKYVEPFGKKGQKVVVVISDALRFEAAAEFAERMRAANRWTAEIEPLFGALPTYTQLGMASLLPGKEWTVATDSSVSVDGKSATGTVNRQTILQRDGTAKAIAIPAERFLDLNAKTEGRALMRENDVIYVFHDVIDKIGDQRDSEARTFDAVEQAFGELDRIVKKIANINGRNIVLTADHGFLFQQDAVEDADMTPLPEAEEWLYRGRRFCLGKGVKPGPGVKCFEPDALGVSGEWTAAFPLSLGRFPLQGSGKRYVHGGFSLQEVVVPVVKIRKARTDDTGQVEIELLRVPAKITTGQVAISLYQDREVEDKVLPRTLRVSVFGPDGSIISESRTIEFESRDAEPRNRETSVILALSHAADAFNNQEVEIRLEETLPGTSQTVTYKSHKLRLQKPFASDFDDD